MSNPKTVVDTDCKKEYDPTLDLTSEHFDPLKALYSDNVTVPYKNAPVYDNISKYYSAVHGPKRTDNASNQSTSSTAISSNTRTKMNKFSASDEPVVRRFLPHQRKALLNRRK